MFTKANSSADSSHNQPTLASSPRSTMKPASTEAEPVAPLESNERGSSTVNVAVLIVLLLPLIVKSPPTVKLPLVATLLELSIVIALPVPLSSIPVDAKLLIVPPCTLSPEIWSAASVNVSLETSTSPVKEPPPVKVVIVTLPIVPP